MVANLCGSFHVSKNKNNQDFYYYKSGKLKMVLDGCSLGEDYVMSHTEVGARLFATLFSMIEDKKREDPCQFENNVKEVFEKLLNIFDARAREERKEYINLLTQFYCFTILACFELEDGFVVKTLGDGYIIAVNKDKNISYLKLDYNNVPPYYIYNLINLNENENYEFETFRFSKEDFINVGVATDGISPFTDEFLLPKADISKLDRFLVNDDRLEDKAAGTRIEAMIKKNKLQFQDDITIVI